MRHLSDLCVSDVSSFMQDEDEENPDEDAARYANRQEDCLPPVIRLERYLCDPNFSRDMVGRAVLETLRTVADCPADVAAIIHIINTLASDPQVMVRAEIVQTLPPIAMLCHNDREQLHHLVPDVILPLVLKLLTDADNQVWKTAQATLSLLMEEGLLEPSTIEEQVCPVLMMLTEEARLTDNCAEAVSLMVPLMVKVVPLVGRDVTEHLLLPRFIALCSSGTFQLRKACASNFSDLCSVMGAECVESVMMPHFVKLCADTVWGVRKACAEVFMSVTCFCSLSMRKSVLAMAFARLLTDESRWVCALAFQQLGPFISTFADPSVTGLACSGQGEIIVINPEGQEYRLSAGRMNDVENSSVGCWTGSIPKSLVAGEHTQICPPVDPPPQPPHEHPHIAPPIDPPPQPPPDPPNILTSSCDTSCAATDILSYNINSNCSNSSLSIPVADLSSLPGTSPNNSSSEASPALSLRLHSKTVSDLPRKAPSKPPGDPPPDPPSALSNYDKEVNMANGSALKVSEVESCQEVGDGGTVSEPTVTVVDRDVRDAKMPDVADQNCTDGGSGRGKYHIHLESGLAPYNTFQYWRMPIPELQLDTSLNDQLKPAGLTIKARVQDEKRTIASELSIDMDIDMELDKLAIRLEESMKVDNSNEVGHKIDNKDVGQCGAVQPQIGTAAVAVITDEHCNSTVLASSVQKAMVLVHPECTSGVHAYACVKPVVTAPNMMPLTAASAPPPPPPLPPSPPAPEELIQDLVPSVLINHFVSMTHSELAKNVDGEIPHHCAFSFPAVALTLGRRHWGLIRGTCERLASHTQWKVRRTVASSIHELARILGEDIATRDLVPIFSGFIKDLDEVRIGILRHLADFLRLLSPVDREMYLPRLEEFHSTDNTLNWRFRHELARQMYLAVELFPPAEVCRHMGPLSLALLVDRVAHVRQQAIVLVSALVCHLSADSNLLRPLVLELEQQLARSALWSHRQTFAVLCSQLVADCSIDGATFCQDWLPPLIALSADRVPNVRLVVARTISRISDTPNFLLKRSEQVVATALLSLLRDKDHDVRFFTAQKEL